MFHVWSRPSRQKLKLKPAVIMRPAAKVMAFPNRGDVWMPLTDRTWVLFKRFLTERVQVMRGPAKFTRPTCVAPPLCPPVIWASPTLLLGALVRDPGLRVLILFHVTSMLYTPGDVNVFRPIPARRSVEL